MRVVWKFEVPSDYGVFQLTVPRGTELFDLDEQEEVLYTWGLVDTMAATEVREFVVIGTGHELPPVDGTFWFVGRKMLRMDDGSFRVVHLFEVLLAEKQE